MLRRRGATRLGSRRRTLSRAYEIEREFVERLLVEEGVGRGELELQLDASADRDRRSLRRSDYHRTIHAPQPAARGRGARHYAAVDEEVQVLEVYRLLKSRFPGFL